MQIDLVPLAFTPQSDALLPLDATISENRLRSVIDSMFAFVGLFSIDGLVLEVNRAPLEAAGLRRNEVIGQPFAETYWWSYSDDAQAQVRHSLSRAAKGETVRKDFQVRVANGRMIVIDATFGPIRDAEGRVTQVVGSGVDITARKQAEEAQQASELLLRQVVENIREVFWMTNVSKTQILYVSPGFEQVWGGTREGLYAEPRVWLDAICTKDRERVLQAWSHPDVGSYNEDYDIVRSDGSVRRIRDRGFPVRDANGVVYRIAGVAEDITEQSRLEEQLRQSQKMEAIGQLAGGVAHDFNNLLTVILGYNQMVLHALPVDSPHLPMLEEVAKAAKRSASLTRQLLAFSRKQVLAVKVLNLNDVVHDTERMLRRVIGEDLDLATVLHPGLKPVNADLGQIEQVLLNLAVNARDAMPLGGRLTLETDNVELQDGSPQVRAGARPGAYVMLAVSDTGVGMTDEVRSRAFEPFFTTKGPGKGTGLGLPVVHGVVKQSHGHIEISSEPNRGTTIRIYLPCSDQHAESATSTHELDGCTKGTETILLVEDEEGVRALSRDTLLEYGYTVLESCNGDEALRVCLDHKEPIHLLVTDVVMPGIGGRQLAERLLSMHPEIKVLYMTGYANDAVVQRGILQDEVDFLQKPFVPLDLARKVRDLLNREPIRNLV